MVFATARYPATEVDTTAPLVCVQIVSDQFGLLPVLYSMIVVAEGSGSGEPSAIDCGMPTVWICCHNCGVALYGLKI